MSCKSWSPILNLLRSYIAFTQWNLSSSCLSSFNLVSCELLWDGLTLTYQVNQVSCKSSQLTTDVPQDSLISVPYLSRSYIFTYHYYGDDIQLYLTFPPGNTTVYIQTSTWLADISFWTNILEIQLLILPSNPTIHRDITMSWCFAHVNGPVHLCIYLDLSKWIYICRSVSKVRWCPYSNWG